MLTITNPLGVRFNVMLVCRGERYGHAPKTTHTADEPLVAFYDARHSGPTFGTLGQFVSAYNRETLLKGDEATGYAGGMDLHGGEEEWLLSEANMADVITWLRGTL